MYIYPEPLIFFKDRVLEPPFGAGVFSINNNFFSRSLFFKCQYIKFKVSITSCLFQKLRLKTPI